MKKNIFKLGLVAILAVMPFIGQQAKAQVPANCSDVMLQGFDYYPEPINLGGTKLSYYDSEWTTLNGQVDEIGASFQMIWLPPSGNAMGAAPSETDPTKKSMGYLPVYWFNQNSSFGTQADLKTLITNLKAKNCNAIADIVVNHRNGVTNWVDFPTESYNGVTYTPNMGWICSDDECNTKGYSPTGAADGTSYEQYPYGRDLAHANNDVRNAIKAYMQFLKTDMGYSGWRYDVAKGFPANYVGDYNDATPGSYSVAEVLECDYGKVEAWINGSGKKSAAFDFPFQCSTRDAFNNNDLTKLVWKFLGTTNQPAGLVHNPDLRRYATTFVENHDTYRYGLGFYGNIEAANAFMLGSPGTPCVYFPHWNKYKVNIKKMIAARKKAGLHSQSAVVVLQTASNIYVGEATGTNGKLIVKVGSGSYSAPAGYTLECSGTDWAMWTNSAPSGPTASISPVGGYYAGGTDVTLSSTGGVAPVKIYYTTNGSTPTASSTLYSAPFHVTDATVKAIAIDKDNVPSPVVSETYTSVQPTGITVGFQVPSGWTTVKVWAWKGTTNYTGGVWPGELLTVNGGWVTYTRPLTDAGFNIIFNNGGNKEQTVDITNITTSICYNTTSSTGTDPKKYNVAVIACRTDLDSHAESKASISIYPNPARETLTVESDLNLSEIQIYSISGVLVESVKVSSNKEVISLENLAPGYYNFVAITEEGTRTTSKLIKK